MPMQGPGMCKGCEQYSRSLLSGYCPPCHDFLREATENPTDYDSVDDAWFADHKEEAC